MVESKKNGNPEVGGGGGLTFLEFKGMGVEHFGIPKARVGLKCSWHSQ